ncbi:MAG: hypothetical protein JWO35_408 [Candidatus Saccharibacteria bacterium]|nr:hypothetical protein [Candidatus Saccharibacteria bacterium]
MSNNDRRIEQNTQPAAEVSAPTYNLELVTATTDVFGDELLVITHPNLYDFSLMKYGSGAQRAARLYNSAMRFCPEYTHRDLKGLPEGIKATTAPRLSERLAERELVVYGVGSGCMTLLKDYCKELIIS